MNEARHASVIAVAQSHRAWHTARMSLRPLIALALCGACATSPSTSAPPTSWDEQVNDFIEQWFKRHPEAAVEAGRHEYDGQIADLSLATFQEQIDWLKAERERFERFPAEQLDERRRHEREYALAVVRNKLFWTEALRWYQKSPLAYSDVFDPEAYVARDYAPLEKRLDGYLKLLESVPHAVEQIEANLSSGPMPKPYSEVGKLVYSGYADFFAKDGPQVFAALKDQKNLAAASQAATQALRGLAAWMGKKNAAEDAPFALGAERMAQLLAETEAVTAPLAKIEALGRADLEKNLAALAADCAKVAPQKPLTACVAQVDANKPPEGPVAGASRQLVSLKRFVIEHDLVSVPGDEDAKVKETPPYERWNAAAIKIPGPFETGLPSWYVIAPPDPAWTKEEREGYVMGEAPLLSVSVHEVWPGHFLNYLHAKRSGSVLGRLFVGYAFGEGWAHYTEEMMVDAGLGSGDPQLHIGQLQMALLRDVRLLSAIGLHSGTMTVDQSEKLFVEKGMQDPANAKQQARRGTFDPGYLNYTLGKWMIRKLREDWCAEHGGRGGWKPFHDQFLSYGGPPIPMVRTWMMGVPGEVL
jgi:uncharacterized protein (DUF885 family)